MALSLDSAHVLPYRRAEKNPGCAQRRRREKRTFAGESLPGHLEGKSGLYLFLPISSFLFIEHRPD